jgi:hypothetical protein
MASLLTSAAQTRATLQESKGERFRLVAGCFMALGVLSSRFGFAWDVNWHTDVGPDTFFTLPHLFIYSGVALTGITSLVMVLYSTWMYQQRQSLFPHSSLTSLFWGILRAPAGFILAGFGSLFFFFYGLFDELWHRVYGFDVTIQSPPHVGLILCMFINIAGAISVFTGATSKTLKLLGVAFSVGITLIAIVLNFQALGRFVTELPEIAIAVSFTFGLVLASSLVRQREAAFFTALTITLFQLLCWYVIPPVTKLYADSLGLFLRDYATGNSLMAAATPMFVLIVALVVEAILWFGRKQNFSVRSTVVVASVVSGVLLVFPAQYLYNLKAITDGNLSFFPSASNVLITALLAVYVSYLAWTLGAVLRRKAQ